MKHTFLTLLFLGNLFLIQAQDISLKYGKVNEDELKMTTYTPDTSAVAVVLFEYSDSHFDFNENKGIRLITNYKTKIKILKDEGLKYVNISIPYYDSKVNSSLKEEITDLQGYVYNLENGKIIKTKLNKEYIFDEQSDENYWQKKFTFPNAKVGSVIEYKYTFCSDFIEDIPDLKTMKKIPIWHSELSLEAPEYFRYNAQAKGWDLPVFKSESGVQTISFSNGYKNEYLQAKTTKYKVIADTVKALKPETHIWCIDDYCPRIEFELNGIALPGNTYKAYAKNWVTLEQNIMADKNFGKLLEMKCPYKDDAENLKKIENKRERARKALKYVQNKISWNGNYSFSGYGTNDALKNGTGNNAQINFVLLSMLKAAGLDAYPVFISTRDNGKINTSFPSLNQINTFIIAIAETDSTYFYLDGGSPYGDINVLDIKLLSENARLFEGVAVSHWENLSNLSRNATSYLIQAKIDENGLIDGTMTIQFTGECAFEFKRSCGTLTLDELKESANNSYDIEINDFQKNDSDTLINQASAILKFNKQTTTNDDMIYFTPLIVDYMSSSPFSSPTRKYPIEFDYNNLDHFNISIKIPDDYSVSELPKSTTLVNPDNSYICRFYSSTTENTINLQFMVEKKKRLFLPEEYKDLQNFYTALISKSTEQIVLKKNK
ncbi:DUF3857 domain-containing protein [Coprobacter tertius]|uniref:DUF3857 domain-containing protein n=1 Tax=Coprobacter tertius TaxID=2944915 RepID=A0ABT1MEF7_9BACT|nr:DUF3857 domain-containing protein [Coprobacter tertius]MCP9611012.1 DUF3857 domain-containing protein [Coprobacter tertius]